VTDPAARAEVTVNVILLVAYAEVETTEAGEVMLHKLMACAVTRPAGKDSVILLLDACAVNGVDVLNVTAAVPPTPTALIIWSASIEAVTAPIAGLLRYAASPAILEVDVSIFKP
jgi:hypothetical protein